jgi:hypothetical protein
VKWGLLGLAYVLRNPSKDGFALGLCLLSLGSTNFYLKTAFEAVVGLSIFLLLYQADLLGSARPIKISKPFVSALSILLRVNLIKQEFSHLKFVL